MTGISLNALERRRIDQLKTPGWRDAAARLVAPVVILLGFLLAAGGGFQVLSGLDAWEAAGAAGDYSWPPGTLIFFVGFGLALAGSGLRARVRDQRLIGTAMTKLIESAKN